MDYQYSNDFPFEIDIENYSEQNEDFATFEEVEAATPVVRPLSRDDIRKSSKSQTSYNPSHYTSASDHSLSEDKSPPLSPSSGDREDTTDNKEPMTPSRLLTLNSFDFMESSPSSNGSRERTSASPEVYSVNQEQFTINDTHNSIMSPKISKDITDEQSKQDISSQRDIVSEYASQLTLSLQDHLSGVIRKLVSQKDTELRGRDAFYTKELQKQQVIIEDLENVVSSYEKRLLKEESSVRTYRNLVEYIIATLHDRFFSPFSLIRLFQHWTFFTANCKKMRALHKLATRHHKKTVLKTAVDAIKREANFSQIERRCAEDRRNFDRTIRDLVSRYEKKISELTLDLKESQESLSQEKSRRQQLEEDLRRTFLKNMTAMNMEALSLFQTPVVSSSPFSEFGPSMRETCEAERVEAMKKRSEEMISVMRKQQHDLQSQQNVKVTTTHIPPKGKRSLMEKRVQRHEASQRRSGFGVDRGAIAFDSPSKNSDIYCAEWEVDEEYPRTSPQPLPYNFSKQTNIM